MRGLQQQQGWFTWMEHLPHRHGGVPLGFEILRQGGVVASGHPPVRVEVVESGGVRSAACQHGRTTWATHRLLAKDTQEYLLWGNT